MDIRNCPECGKIFTYIRTNLCPACQQKDEEAFRVVRTYLAQHPGVDILTVAETTGVSEENIIRYVREGRITMGIERGFVQINCEICGVLISHGRLCQTCSEKLSSGLKKSIQEENKKALDEQHREGPRMYTADHWLNRRR